MSNKTFMSSHYLRVMISESLKSARKKWDSYKVRNDPDFRRAANKIKIMYYEVIYTSSPRMDESEMGPSDFHVKESDGDPFYNKYH